MSIKHYIFLVALCIPFVLVFSAKAQQQKNSEIELIIKDAGGSPLKGVAAYGNEGAIIASSDGTGKVRISVRKSSDILLEISGYESKLISADDYEGELSEIVLTKEPNFLTKEDEVPVAFGSMKNLDISGAITTITSADLLKYDLSLTLDQALPGLIPGLYSIRKGNLEELNKGPIAFRGNAETLGALVIVDGLPRSWETISLSEIDKISFLKDAHSSVLFGSEAANGVVLITTKRGEAYKQKIDVYAYYGMEIPKALPKYLSSADYLELYSLALQNDGLAPYDPRMIENYRSGNPYQYPSVDYYSKDYLRSAAPFSNIIANLSGGNKNVAYFTNLAWEQSSDLPKIGSANGITNNAFKARGNVDLKVNSWIKTSIDAFARFENNGFDQYSRTLVGNYWIQAASLRPDLYSPLIPVSLIDPNNAELQAATNIIDGKYLLGGNAQNLNGPVARLYSAGEIDVVQRWFQFNNRISFDLDRITKGLSLNTNFSFDFWTNYQQSTPNTFAVYEPVWTDGKISSLKKHGEDARPGTQNVSTGFFERRFGATVQLAYDRTFDSHRISASALGYLTRRQQTGQYQGEKNSHLGFNLAYIYDHKYILDFSGNIVNSVKLPDGNRVGFSPTAGIGWVISSEDFLKDAKSVDLLKLRLSAGILNTDYGFRNNWYESGSSGFFWYDDAYGASGSYNWKDGASSASGTVASYGPNSHLFFEKRKDVNIGIDALFLNRMIGINATAFIQRNAGLVTRVYTQYPSFYGNFVPYNNFNENEYRGFEAGVTFNKNFGDFLLNINGTLLYTETEVIKRDESYAYDYLYRAGKSVNAIFGLVADGFYKDENDIKSSPYPTFGQVRPGDIKYRDQNNDGIIDNSDQVQIGLGRSPLMFGINILAGYKGFTFLITGMGRTGADSYIPDNGYYRPRSSQKYSEYIVGKHWTQSTASTATMPRLTTTDATNNNQNSTFWLYRDNYMYLEKIQLNYNFPEKICRPIHTKALALFLRGTGLLTISDHKDIKDLSIGSRPYMRSFSAGLKVSF
jgi:TonB-linked SusC/RagA family outer membrane protein